MVTVRLTQSAVPPISPIQLKVHLDTTLQISASEACRLINHQLVPEMGTGLIAGDPELVVLESGIYWRVPLMLSLPRLGDLGQVGTIDVDAMTGKVLNDEMIQQRIIQHARRLYKGATLSAK